MPLSSLTLNAFKLAFENYQLLGFINVESSLSKSLGLQAENRIILTHKRKSITVTVIALPPHLCTEQDIGLSISAWDALALKDGEKVEVKLADPCSSFNHVKSKLYGHPYSDESLRNIVDDISQKKYSNAEMTAFLTSCLNLTVKENIFLTKNMTCAGEQITWSQSPIVDLHCVGGIPGNRTTLIVVPIIAAFGLIIPKISSKAITSPAGTADTMNVFSPIALNTNQLRRVVEKEGGCIVWGGGIELSPMDEVMISVEHMLDINSSQQLVASILSQKKAVGSTHILFDIPIGKTAKIRSQKEEKELSSLLSNVAKAIGLTLHIMETDGSQPIGKGFGPVLEAIDVLSVLRCEKEAPQDLRTKSLLMAGVMLEAWGGVPKGEGLKTAEDLLTSGAALKKFEAICKAQGSMKEPVRSSHKEIISSPLKGTVSEIHNGLIARIAKLAGAPDFPAAGLELHVALGTHIEKGQPLITLYAESSGELEHALRYFLSHPETIVIEEI